nr:MlaD family protein [Haloechinothrix aidingensis]
MLAVTAAGVGLTNSDEPARKTVVSVFTDAGPLEPGNEVRSAGVVVGAVEKISLEDGNAHVSLTVDSAVLPLHRDANVTLRPVDLLGEHYVELDPGSPSEPFMEPPVIPADQTGWRPTLQNVLNTFDDPTSTALAAVVTTLGEGMDKSGADAAAAIEALAPAMKNTGKLGKVLHEQNAVLNELTERVRPIADALAAKNGEVLDATVESTERTLSTVAANKQALNETLSELPDTIATARRTLRQVAGVSDAATPTLKSIRPVTDDLADVTSELQTFTEAADPALASLPPVLKRADALLEQAAPAVAKLRDAGPDLRDTAESLRPVGDVLLDDQLHGVMEFVRKWSLSTNGRDALGHYFRGVFHVTPKTLADLAEGAPLGEDEGAPLGETGLPRPDASEELPAVPEGVPDDLVGGDSGSSDPDNATGLTQEQEQSMLDQLLGGS